MNKMCKSFEISNAARSKCVLLGNAAIRVESDQSTFTNARALVDPCSEIT